MTQDDLDRIQEYVEVILREGGCHSSTSTGKLLRYGATHLYELVGEVRKLRRNMQALVEACMSREVAEGNPGLADLIYNLQNSEVAEGGSGAEVAMLKHRIRDLEGLLRNLNQDLKVLGQWVGDVECGQLECAREVQKLQLERRNELDTLRLEVPRQEKIAKAWQDMSNALCSMNGPGEDKSASFEQACYEFIEDYLKEKR